MLAIQAPFTAAQETIQIRVENLPGRLESFLSATPNVSVAKKVTGTLDSSGKATFTAMVATNPVSHAQERGLEIRLEQGDVKAVVYLDQNCLQSLHSSLEFFRRETKDVTDHRPHVTTIYNDLPGTPETEEKAGILQVGWYGYDDGWGMHLSVPPGKNGRGGGQFYLPQARFEKLLEIINSTMMFLSSN